MRKVVVVYEDGQGETHSVSGHYEQFEIHQRREFMPTVFGQPNDIFNEVRMSMNIEWSSRGLHVDEEDANDHG